MNYELVIERLSEKNFNNFLHLIEKLAEYENLDPPNSDAKIRLKKDGISKNPKYEAFLGIINGKPVSYIIYFMTYSSFLALPTLYLEDIFVLKEHRKKGIGQEMFDFCVKQAKKRDCGRLELCVLDWNEPAIKFYKKNKLQCLDWKFFRLNREQINKYPNN